MNLKIGTRGSKLALWQANKVKDLLAAQGVSAELVLIKTTGDKEQIKPLHQIGQTGLFTKALDDALLGAEIDLAVHSSKDMPSSVPAGLELVAFLQREDPRDVLLAVDPDVDLDNFSRKIVLGTSSLRRQALVRHYLPNCELKLIRGNVDTRVSKMKNGDYDGILLAYAGVKRMGMTELVRRKLNVNTFTPAVGQGAIAVAGRAGDKDAERVRAILNHRETELAVEAERAFMRTLEGGCQTPMFALATVMGDTISMQGGLASVDGTVVLRETVEGHANSGEVLGTQLANQLINQGATEILNG